jgi:hypothetical protein
MALKANRHEAGKLDCTADMKTYTELEITVLRIADIVCEEMGQTDVGI